LVPSFSSHGVRIFRFYENNLREKRLQNKLKTFMIKCNAMDRSFAPGHLLTFIVLALLKTNITAYTAQK
jgi:hypothetical protein